jgi:hypothetical protein
MNVQAIWKIFWPVMPCNSEPTDFVQELSASIFRVEEYTKQELAQEGGK